MEHQGHFQVTEVCEKIGVRHDFVVHCLREHWVQPAAPEVLQFDDEDVARFRLIRELQEDLGVNDESVPIILHLLDQLHYFRNRMKDVFPEGESLWPH